MVWCFLVVDGFDLVVVFELFDDLVGDDNILDVFDVVMCDWLLVGNDG